MQLVPSAGKHTEPNEVMTQIGVGFAPVSINKTQKQTKNQPVFAKWLKHVAQNTQSAQLSSLSTLSTETT